jgi:hypothetical protein
MLASWAQQFGVHRFGVRSEKPVDGYEVTVSAAKTYSWKVITLGSGAVAGLVTQRLLEAAWGGLRNQVPIPRPADRRATWTDAVSWAVATGVGAGVARLIAIRTAARVWEAAIHETPPEPGLES